MKRGKGILKLARMRFNQKFSNFKLKREILTKRKLILANLGKKVKRKFWLIETFSFKKKPKKFNSRPLILPLKSVRMR